MKLALFDFDGTITSRDSFLHFLWVLNKVRLLSTFAFASPAIFLYWSRRLEAERLKELFLTRMLAGQTERDLEQIIARYCKTKLPAIIRPDFWKRLNWHRQHHAAIAVVSASPRLVLAPWCRAQGIDLIATELETDEAGRLTGRIDGANCKGEEKVSRINEAYDLNSYTEVFAYGDTPSDLPMLELAAPDHRFYQPFQ